MKDRMMKAAGLAATMLLSGAMLAGCTSGDDPSPSPSDAMMEHDDMMSPSPSHDAMMEGDSMEGDSMEHDDDMMEASPEA